MGRSHGHGCARVLPAHSAVALGRVPEQVLQGWRREVRSLQHPEPHRRLQRVSEAACHVLVYRAVRLAAGVREAIGLVFWFALSAPGRSTSAAKSTSSLLVGLWAV